MEFNLVKVSEEEKDCIECLAAASAVFGSICKGDDTAMHEFQTLVNQAVHQVLSYGRMYISEEDKKEEIKMRARVIEKPVSGKIERVNIDLKNLKIV